MELTVVYELTGCVNGAQVTLAGTGTADPGEGRLALALSVTQGPVPLGWDPALVLLGGLDVPLLAAAAGPGQTATPFPADGLPVLGRTRADVLDDQGRELGTAKLTWHAGLEADVLSWRGQLYADVRFEILEQVTSFSPVTGVIFPAGAESVLATAVGFETNRGNWCRCVATARVEPPLLGVAGVQRLSVERVGLERDRGGRGVGLELVARVEGLVPRR